MKTISSSCLTLQVPEATIPFGGKHEAGQIKKKKKELKRLENEMSIESFVKFQYTPGDLESHEYAKDGAHAYQKT